VRKIPENTLREERCNLDSWFQRVQSMKPHELQQNIMVTGCVVEEFSSPHDANRE
jgi:hypothetical protein